MHPNWGDKYSILLIAGDEATHFICQKTFELFKDIVFIQEENPMEGRITAGSCHPDLVITDVEFPDQDKKISEGYYRATRLICPLTKFIIYSYVREEIVISRYLRMGVESYLFKPVAIEHLLEKAFTLIGKPYPDWMYGKMPFAKEDEYE